MGFLLVLGLISKYVTSRVYVKGHLDNTHVQRILQEVYDNNLESIDLTVCKQTIANKQRGDKKLKVDIGIGFRHLKFTCSRLFLYIQNTCR